MIKNIKGYFTVYYNCLIFFYHRMQAKESVFIKLANIFYHSMQAKNSDF